MLIRWEKEADKVAIQAVNESEFDATTEANLVTTSREQAQPVISLIAEDKGTIVGHIMFSPVTLIEHPEPKIMGLSPMAVVPERQREGIGSALIHEGLEECKKIGCGAVVFLGHPDYYQRFGFSPSSRFGIRSEYDVPEGVFMLIELQPGNLLGAKGTVKYHAAFSNI